MKKLYFINISLLKKININYQLFDKYSLKSLLKESGFSFFLKIVSAFSGIIMNLAITRTLGMEKSGYFFLSFTIISIFSAIARLGLDNVIIKFASVYKKTKKWNKVCGIYVYSFLMVLITSTLFAILLRIYSRWISINIFNSINLKVPLEIMSWSVIFLSLIIVNSNMLQGLEKIKTSIISTNIFYQIATAISIFFLYFNNKIINESIVSITYLLCIFLSLLISSLFLFRIPEFSVKFIAVSYRDIMKSSMPLLMVVLMVQIVQWSSPILLGYFTSPKAVSVFTVSQKTAMLTSFVLISVNYIIAPKFSSLYSSGNIDSLKKVIYYSNKIMIIFAVPIIGIILFFSNEILGLYGDEFRQYGLILQILSIAQFVNVSVGSVGYLLIMCGFEKDMRNAVAFSSLVNIVVGIPFILVWEIYGAAISTSISILLQNIILCHYAEKRLNINTLSLTFKFKMDFISDDKVCN